MEAVDMPSEVKWVWLPHAMIHMEVVERTDEFVRLRHHPSGRVVRIFDYDEQVRKMQYVELTEQQYQDQYYEGKLL